MKFRIYTHEQQADRRCGETQGLWRTVEQLGGGPPNTTASLVSNLPDQATAQLVAMNLARAQVNFRNDNPIVAEEDAHGDLVTRIFLAILPTYPRDTATPVIVDRAVALASKLREAFRHAPDTAAPVQHG